MPCRAMHSAGRAGSRCAMCVFVHVHVCLGAVEHSSQTAWRGDELRYLALDAARRQRLVNEQIGDEHLIIYNLVYN